MTEPRREYDLEVWQGDLCVAVATSYDFEEAYSAILDYAIEYAKEGEIEVRGIPNERSEELRAVAAIAERSQKTAGTVRSLLETARQQ